MTDRVATRPGWMRILACWFFVSAGLMVLGWVVIFPARLGILVHPPLWYEILAGAVVFGVVVAGYVFGLRMDGRPGTRRMGAGNGLAVAASVGAMTLVVVGWALPGMSVFAFAQPKSVTMTVTDVSRPGRRSMRGFCRYEVRFAPVLAGGGSLCLSNRRAHDLEGATLEMIGRGNALATKVNAITAVEFGLAAP